MPKRFSKFKDANETAFAVVSQVIRQTEGEAVLSPKLVAFEPSRRKNPAAVALGRRGGLKSAKARLEKIDPAERSRIASNAARARWKKDKKRG